MSPPEYASAGGQPQGGAGGDRDDGDASSPRRGAAATTAQVPTTGQTTGQTARTIRTGTADDRQLLGRFTTHRASFLKYFVFYHV